MSAFIKLRYDGKGGHVHVRVFMGKTEDSLALTGTLIMDVSQFQVFGAALVMGCERTQGHLVLLHVDPVEELAAYQAILPKDGDRQ